MDYNKIFKSKKSILIVALVLVAITIGLFVASYIVNKKKYEGVQMHTYNDLISKNEDKENMLVKLEIADLPYLFATKDEKNTKYKFYFAFDENNYWYIVRITDDTYKKMEEQYNQDKDNFKYVLKGYIYDDEAELKKLAISAYNEGLPAGAEKLTLSNFKDYLGSTYLDEVITPTSSETTTLMGIGIGVGILALVFVIIYTSQLIRLKSTLKKYNIEELKEELSNCNIDEYKKQNVYLTNKYVISTINGLDVFEYKDILWIYNEKRKQNGILLGVWIIACTKDKKKIQIASAKKDDILIQIMSRIKEKNQDMLVGFTSDNVKQYKELTKKEKIENI